MGSPELGPGGSGDKLGLRGLGFVVAAVALSVLPIKGGPVGGVEETGSHERDGDKDVYSVPLSPAESDAVSQHTSEEDAPLPPSDAAKWAGIARARRSNLLS